LTFPAFSVRLFPVSERNTMKNEMKNETTVIAPSDVSYRGLADGGALVTCCGCGEEVRINSEEADQWSYANLFECHECE